MTDTQHCMNTAPPGRVPAEIQAAPQLAGAGAPAGELVTTATARLGAHHSGFAEFHEGYVRHYIGLADTKSAWTFTISAGLIAYVIGSDKFQGVLMGPVWSPQFVFLGATVIFLVLSAFCSFLVIAPSLASSSGEGIVHFRAVASRTSADEYVRDIASRSEENLTAARLKHCYDISGICARKYRYLKGAIWLVLPALVGMAVVLLST